MEPQANATRLSEDLIKSIVQTAVPGTTWPPLQIRHRDHYSNDFADVRLSGGRALIIKRGRFPWTRSRFRSSRMAARLIHRATDISVPSPLGLPPELAPEPIEAYWRIDLPILRDIWGRLGRRERSSALRSLGELLAKLHDVPVRGVGPLGDPATSQRSLSEYLYQELEQRLRGAVDSVWPAARAPLATLIDAIPEVEDRPAMESRLLHSDFHMGNILCRLEQDGVSCVGMVDLETSMAGPPEADMASLEIQHGPLFNHPIDGDWLPLVREGYGEWLDPWLVRFFRAFHLLNMGFYSAMIGHLEHASRVAAGLEAETSLLGSDRPMILL